MNSNELKAAMVRRGITGRDLAKAVGVSETTIYAKINGDIDFKLGEVASIIKFMNLSAD